MDVAARGKAALEAKNYEDAIALYTEAIAASPTSPAYHIQRSTAYQRAKKHEAALADAEKGLAYAVQRARREFKAQAQLRRGIALYHLKRYGDAMACLEWSKKLDDKEKSLAIWEKQTAAKLKTLPDDDPAAKVTVSELPTNIDLRSPAKPVPHQASAPIPVPESKAASQVSPPQPTPKDKIRHDWYQNNENVYFTLLAKGVPKDEATITIESHSLSISFPIGVESTYDYSLEPLFAPIDVAKSSFTVLSTKVEVVLKKATPGLKWKALEGTDPLPVTSTEQTSDPITTESLADVKKSVPVYPTSSRTGPKNWDKISNDLTSKKKDGEEGEGYDSDEGDADGFFRKLYAGASDEARRAMNKSYQESGGTTLSTNWEDIGKRTLSVDAPDGMEAKKW